MRESLKAAGSFRPRDVGTAQLLATQQAEREFVRIDLELSIYTEHHEARMDEFESRILQKARGYANMDLPLIPPIEVPDG